MTDELKPCPFCGGDAMTCFDDERMIFRHSVECIVCGGRSGWYSTKEVAATAWNARAAVTDEQFSLAVHEWALARMEGCDEPEWSMYSGIVDAIGRHRAASAKVVG